MIENTILPGIQKIAVLRANALGDFIYSLPALDSLRAAYPEAEIVLLGRAWHQEFLKSRPSPIDRVVVTPFSKGVNEPSILEMQEWSEDPQELTEFFECMQAEQFDLAIQLHGGGANSNPFLLKLGAKFTAGMKTPDAPALDRWMPFRYWQNEIFRLLECMELVGAKPVTIKPHLEVTDADHLKSLAVVADTGNHLAVIHPGATDGRRHWGDENFAAVGDHLWSHGFEVLVIGTQAEYKQVQNVVGLMKQRAHNLAGMLSMNALVGLLRRASILVGNDSGPVHLAEALDVPSIAIYWGGNMVNFGPTHVTRHRQLLSWRLDCPICGRDMIYDNCEHHVSFVDHVKIPQVIAEVEDLLAYTQKAS